MKACVIVFPGSNCDMDNVRSWKAVTGLAADLVWHKETSVPDYDLAIVPGGFSFGDYLRTGAVARFSPVMSEVARLARRGSLILGICNGFQILTEAQLLPGALLRNKGLKFICAEVALRVEDSVCQWVAATDIGKKNGPLWAEPAADAVGKTTGMASTEGSRRDSVPRIVRLPINHNEGNYSCDKATLAELQANGQVVLRYCAADGSSPVGLAPNGALDNIAGICNRRGNVFGLMPHPERVTDGISGNRDGVEFFNSICQTLCAV